MAGPRQLLIHYLADCMLPHHEDALERFENAWRSERKPAIASVLRDVKAGASEPTQRALAIELVKVDLEYRWRAAQARGRKSALKLEAYATRLPILGTVAELPLDLIAEEYRVRRRFGDAPQMEEYFARFIHPRAELAAALEAVDTELAEERVPLAVATPRAPRLLRRAVDPQAPLYYGDYVLKRQIGSGGLCRVYAGVQLSLRKEVAIKVLRRQFWNSPDAVGRFLREAQIVALLPREGIVGIHGLGRLPRGGYFMVMDLVDGLDFRALKTSGHIHESQAAEIVATAAEIVGRVHAAGYVHGDIKPANLLLEYGGRVQLTDFGFARQLGAAEVPGQEWILGGTPAFLAPELASGFSPPASPAIDVFGLGAVLLWLLTGRAVHEQCNVGDLQRSLHESTWDARVCERMPTAVPSPLVDICRRCLARDPKHRPAPDEVATQCRQSAPLANRSGA
jgi:eukaryotic-like serine/threonine-protein kinase